jgi:translocation and assembly module TamB
MDPTPPPSANTDPRAAPRPWATAASMFTPLAWVLGSALLVLVLAALALHLLLQREAGTRWLLAQLPGLQVQGWQGALLGERWRAERLQLSWNQGRAGAVVEQLDAGALHWRWRPGGGAWFGVEIDELRIGRVVVNSGPPGASTAPMTLPQSIALPLQLSLRRARVERIELDQQPAVTQLQLEGLVLDPRHGGEHRLARLAAVVAGVDASLSARVGTAAPLPLAVQARLAPAAGSTLPPWTADLTLGGDARLTTLAATLAGPAAPGRPAPSAQLTAGLRLLEAWPVTALALRTQDLDLSALHDQAPRTRLSGEATLRMSARDAPALARIELANAAPGRWNEGRVPVSRLTADLSGTLAQPDRLDLARAELVLAGNGRPAGRVGLSGRWQGTVLELQAQLEGLAPARLDERAPAMSLSGPLELRLAGLPSPDGRPPAAGTPDAPSLRWNLDLLGRLDGTPLPVRVTMEGEADDRRLVVPRLRASAGTAQTDATLTLAREGAAAQAPWRLATAGSVVDFDPLPWWPGAADSPWRRGTHRLSGGWSFDGRLPGNAATLAPLDLLQRLAGNGRLRLADSVLAGVPVAADIALGYTQAAAPSTALLRGELRAAGNVLRLEGRGDPTGPGQADQWTAELQADALPGLAPLFALHPDAAAWAPRRGTLTVNLAASGRWPALRTEGRARASQLQLGTLTLAQGQAQWRFDSSGERSLSGNAELGGIVYGEQRADHLRASVDGTLAAHRIDLSGAAPLSPSPLLLRLLGVSGQTGTRAQLVAQGGWRGEAAGGGRWQARVQRVLVGAWDGSEADSAPASLWAQARDLDATLDFGPDYALKSLRAGAGRAQLSDVLTLRWDEAELRFAPGRTDMNLRADIEPFRLAPLLRRVQPGIGWEGDLRLAAKLDVRAGERFDAELMAERRDGDLHINSAEGLLLLGLNEVRLGLVAHDGRWTLTPVFRGRSLGEVTGSATAVTTPERRVPHDGAPLSGSLQARVADMGIWGAWVPAGWRLSGELRTQAQLSGTVRQPRLTGEMSGSNIAVRNLLQGVNVSDGQLAVRLDGDRARIERLTLKGGEGRLSVTGEATLSGTPQARLAIEAEKFRVIGRVDRQAVASGSAVLQLAPERGQLDGRFRIDEGLFDTSRSDAPSLDEDVTVMAPGAERSGGDTEAPKPRRNFQLGLDLDLGERLRVRGRGLDTLLRGQLRLTTPGGRLAINGAIRTDEGTYAAYGQKLELERGIISFSGPPEEPRLDILAMRPNIDARVGVAITGTAVAPRVRLYSEPDLGETEKLSWLVLGRGPDNLGRNDTALLQRAAVALLAGEGEPVTDQLLGRLGIDDLSLRQGDTDVRETVISLGKQLSRRWYLGYERGVNSTTGTWQLVYRIAQRFTLRAQSGLENSLDVIWSWRFQETPPEAAMQKSTIRPR